MADPDLLYHYTDSAGLLGLLGTPTKPACLWLSQIQFMNDSDEWFHAFDMAVKRFEGLGEDENEFAVIRELATSIIQHWRKDPDRSHRDQIGMQRSFVFSLSRKDDLLSQWRGYAAKGGYCVGFKRQDLVALAASNDFKLVRCYYTQADKTAVMDEAFTSNMLSLRLGSRKHKGATVDAIMRNVNFQAGFFKNESFEEEAEERLEGTLTVQDGRARWRTSGNLILPYCELQIGPNTPAPVPIRRIITGPGVDPTRAKAAIDDLASFHSQAIEVVPSKSTLRI